MPFITGGQKPIRRNDSDRLSLVDFGREVVLEPWFPDLDSVSSTAVAFSDIEVRPHKVSFTVQADRPTVAVIPVSWHPAWVGEVTKPGAAPVRMPLLKANVAFQAIPIPAGQSQVVLYYSDARLRAECCYRY